MLTFRSAFPLFALAVAVSSFSSSARASYLTNNPLTLDPGAFSTTPSTAYGSQFAVRNLTLFHPTPTGAHPAVARPARRARTAPAGPPGRGRGTTKRAVRPA